jgi:hypothetical protein
MDRRQVLASALGMALSPAITAPSARSSPAQPIPSSSVLEPFDANKQSKQGVKVGMFYTAWWEEQDRFKHWFRLKGPNQSTPVLGHYSAGDPKIIRRHYEMMRECGVDFLIFDDSNGVFVDDRIVDNNIRAWFDFMDALPAQERIWLCIAFGGELNQHKDPRAFREAADYLYATYAHRPSYWRRDEKPFILWYIEGDVIDDWKDERWFIRRCHHFFLTERQGRTEGWGWGSKPYPPDNKECMSFFPGWSFGDNPPIERRRGDYFMDCWLRVVQAMPRYVAIADWNQWHERCAVEDTTDWWDLHDYSTPDWYRQIIQGYKAMTQGTLLPGWYYRLETSPNVYQVVQAEKGTPGELKAVYQGQFPHRHPVLRVPENWQGNIALPK